MSAPEFVRRLHAQAGEPDRHYVLWLGAGCSVTSGIPAAGSLVKEQWLPKLHHLRTGGGDVESWARDAFPDYDPANPGTLYGPLIGELFVHREDQQRETERLCADRHPGF